MIIKFSNAEIKTNTPETCHPMLEKLKRADNILLDMEKCTCKSELELLQKHWDCLTDNQRFMVIDKCYGCNCIAEDVLDELTLKTHTPHIDDFPIPYIEMCNDLIEKMTPDEIQKLEGYIGFTIKDLMEQIETSDVLFNVLQCYLARNFNLNLPPLKLFVIPDRYEIPFTIRKKTRRELRKCLNSHRQHSA